MAGRWPGAWLLLCQAPQSLRREEAIALLKKSKTSTLRVIRISRLTLLAFTLKLD